MLSKKFYSRIGVLPPPVPTDGLYAYFRTGTTNNAPLSKYSYAANTNIALTFNNMGLSGKGVSNGVVGIFFVASTGTTASNRLQFSNETYRTTTGMQMNFGSGASSFGNDTHGYLTNNNNLGTTRRHAYATEAVADATTLPGTGASGGVGYGLLAYGIIATGRTTKTTTRYTYSSQTVTTGSMLVTDASGAQAVSSSVLALIAVGNAGMLTNKYSYAADTYSASTNLLNTVSGMQAAGNNTAGLFVVGTSPTALTNRYTHSSDTVSVGAALTANTNGSNPSALSGGIVGVNVQP